MEAGNKVEDNYTADSWKVLSDALALAEDTQNKIDSKVSSIRTALDSLVEKTVPVDYTVLNTEINNANNAKLNISISIDGKDLTDGTKWVTQSELDSLNSVITSATALVNNSEATQSEIDSKVNGLKTAIDTFNASIKTVSLDTTSLNTEINNANNAKLNISISIDGKDLANGTKWTTQQDIDSLTSAVTSATALINNSEAAQSEIDSKVNGLKTAIDTFNASIKTVSLDTTSLDNIKLEAGNKVESNYTADSWKALSDALALAEDTQNNIDSKVSAIRNALDSLILKEIFSSIETTIATQEVYYGTTIANAINNLPKVVTIVSNNNIKTNVDVTWNSIDYTGESTGTYTFTGSFTLPQDWKGTAQNVETTVKVVLQSPDYITVQTTASDSTMPFTGYNITVNNLDRIPQVSNIKVYAGSSMMYEQNLSNVSSTNLEFLVAIGTAQVEIRYFDSNGKLIYKSTVSLAN